MIFFNILSDILCNTLIYLNVQNETILYFASGIFEVVEGIKKIATSNSTSYSAMFNSIIYISILLGFSGLSVIFQVKNEFKSINISLKTLITSKLLHGILSGIITYILLKNTNILDTTALNVYSNIEINKDKMEQMYNFYINSCAILLFGASTYLLIKYNKKEKNTIKKLLG